MVGGIPMQRLMPQIIPKQITANKEKHEEKQITAVFIHFFKLKILNLRYYKRILNSFIN